MGERPRDSEEFRVYSGSRTKSSSPSSAIALAAPKGGSLAWPI
jgi:hypothetical protein